MPVPQDVPQRVSRYERRTVGGRAVGSFGEAWRVLDGGRGRSRGRFEATARDRLDNVMCRMEKYFDNPSAAGVFRNRSGTYKSGPARVITESLVAGLKPAEFKDKVEGVLRMKTGWKSDPDLVFGVVEQAATDYAHVEAADTFRRSSAAKPKSAVSGGARAGASAVKSDGAKPNGSGSRPSPKRRSGDGCWTCGW